MWTELCGEPCLPAPLPLPLTSQAQMLRGSRPGEDVGHRKHLGGAAQADEDGTLCPASPRVHQTFPRPALPGSPFCSEVSDRWGVCWVPMSVSSPHCGPGTFESSQEWDQAAALACPSWWWLMGLETLMCVLRDRRETLPSLSVMNHGHSHCPPVSTWPAALGVTSITQGSWEAGSNPAAFGPFPTAARTCRKMGPGKGLPGCLAGLAGSWAQKGSSSGAALFLLLLAGPLGHDLSHLSAGGAAG